MQLIVLTTRFTDHIIKA